MKMKKTLLALTSVVALGACTTERVIERVPVEATQAPYVDNSSYGDQNFIDGLTEDYPTEVATLGKVKTIELGKVLCGSIDEGMTIKDLLQMASGYNIDAGFIGALVREAVQNFCPENQWFIDSAVNGVL